MSEENKYLFGLSPHDIEQLLETFRKEEAIEEVVLYGSRARNTFERGSDVDLAIKGKGVDSMLIALLKHTLEEETSIPYFFDVTDYQTISNEKFRKNIDRQGKPIYKKGYRLTKEGELVPEEWKETTLGELASDIAYGYTESATQQHVGPKFLRITDIQNDFIDWDGVPFCHIAEKEHKKYKLEIGDVVIARTGNSTGATATIKDNLDAVFASYLIRFRIDPQKAVFQFIDFLLRSDFWKAFVKSVKGGSAQGGANAKNFSEFPVLLPPINEQRAIAAVLSSLDDKIELLWEQNKTLEETAQVIFREWFVKGSWETQRLGDLVEVKRGGSPRPIQDYISDSGLRWLKISDASATAPPYIFEIKEHIKEEGLKKTTLLKAGSLVLSNSATPGIPKILAVDSCIHDGWLHFPKSRFSNEFLYLLFQEIKPQLVQQGSGSVFTNLKTDILKDYKAPLPDDKTLQKFDDSIKPVFEKIYNNASQIQTLSTLRETLLPQLMRGEVRVEVSSLPLHEKTIN